MLPQYVSLSLIWALLAPFTAQADLKSCEGNLASVPYVALEKFRSSAQSAKIEFEREDGRPRPFVAEMRRFADRSFTEDERRTLCRGVAGEIQRQLLIEIDGALALKLARAFCRVDRRAYRAIAASALAVIDHAAATAYLGILDDRPSQPGRRTDEARRFLRGAIRDEDLSGVDWREILAVSKPRHFIPLIDALSAERRDFSHLHFPEGERIELARRLLRADLPYAKVVKWTALIDPKALASLEPDLDPLQWLAHARARGRTGDLGFATDFETRVGAWTKPRATNTLADRRRSILDAILDPAVPISTLARVVKAIEEQWPKVYGNDQVLPPFETKGLDREILQRAELFYPRMTIDPEAYRIESKRVTDAAAKSVAALLRSPDMTAQGLRDELEKPLRDFVPHTDDFARIFSMTTEALARSLPRVRTAAGWITLAQTHVPVNHEGRMRPFVGNYLPDLVRAGPANLESLDERWDRGLWYLQNLHADNPTSILGLIRTMRDSVAPAARDDRTLMVAAVDRALNASQVAGELMTRYSDEVLTTAMRDSRTWQKRATYLRSDLREALTVHVQRAMIVHLLGRSMAGQSVAMTGPRAASLRRIVEASMQKLQVVHVDSIGRVFVKVLRSKIP